MNRLAERIDTLFEHTNRLALSYQTCHGTTFDNLSTYCTEESRTEYCTEESRSQPLFSDLTCCFIPLRTYKRAYQSFSETVRFDALPWLSLVGAIVFSLGE